MNTRDFLVRAATLSDSAGVSALLSESFPSLMRSDYEPEILDPALELMTHAQPALLASGTYMLPRALTGRLLAAVVGPRIIMKSWLENEATLFLPAVQMQKRI